MQKIILKLHKRQCCFWPSQNGADVIKKILNIRSFEDYAFVRVPIEKK